MHHTGRVQVELRATFASMKARLESLAAAAEGGDRAAAETLFAALYAELHRLAKHHLGGSRLTLGTTTLLHEAYLNMSRQQNAAFPDRARFMAYASRVMRGIVIDYVRSRGAQKRGGEFVILPLVDDRAEAEPEDRQLQRVSDCLDELASVDAALTEVVDLHFFCGFSFGEIAAMRGVSERTVQRHWEKARLFLRHAMRGKAESRR